MPTVFQFLSVEPVEGVTALLIECLDRKLPQKAPHSVVVVGLDLATERPQEINRILKNQSKFTLEQLKELFDHGGLIRSGWFFAGTEFQLPVPPAPLNLPDWIAHAQFVIDILDGRMLFVRTIHSSIAQSLRQMAMFKELDPVDLLKVQLTS